MRYCTAESTARKRGQRMAAVLVVASVGLSIVGILNQSAWALVPVALLSVISIVVLRKQERQWQVWDDERDGWFAEAFEQDILLRQVGHELRTRLNGVLGYADLLLFDAPSPEAQEKLLTIQRHGGYLVHLLSDLMDVAKKSSDELVVATHFSPTTLVREALSIVEPEAETVGKPTSCLVEADSPTLILGRTKGLRQSLCNAIQAALHLPGESVLVRVDFDSEKGALVVRITNPEGGWSDLRSWLGIETSDALRLGDDPSRTAPWLYFHIAEQVAKKLDGSIFWESNDSDDRESMRLEFPATVSSNEVVETVQQPIQRLDNVHLLVIDDSIDNQRIIRHFLELAGATVDVADNGHTGGMMVHSAASRGHAYDAILMDMQMPIMNGYLATERLRAEGCDLPIIAVTAYALDGDRNKCLGAGCDEYITKPIKRSELLQVVESQLKGRQEPTVVI